MEEVLKEKIRIWKKKEEGSKKYYELIELESKYKSYDENIMITWIAFLFGSMFTFMLGLPILFPLAIISTIYNGNKMKAIAKNIEGTIK